FRQNDPEHEGLRLEDLSFVVAELRLLGDDSEVFFTARGCELERHRNVGDAGGGLDLEGHDRLGAVESDLEELASFLVAPSGPIGLRAAVESLRCGLRTKAGRSLETGLVDEANAGRELGHRQEIEQLLVPLEQREDTVSAMLEGELVAVRTSEQFLFEVFLTAPEV